MISTLTSVSDDQPVALFGRKCLSVGCPVLEHRHQREEGRVIGSALGWSTKIEVLSGISKPKEPCSSNWNSHNFWQP